MKYLSIVTAGVLLIASCGNHESANKDEKAIVAADHTSAAPANNQDSIDLTKLVRSVYKWQDAAGQGNDFDPKDVEGDSLYRGIDWDTYNKRVKKLKET